MKKLLVLFMLGTGGFCAVLGWGSRAGMAQDKPNQDQPGVETLLRGPVHEAYAAPQSLDPKPSPIVPKQPPEPIPEMPPDQKPEGSHVVWISGYWAWDDDQAQYVWVSGFWRDLPPGKRWIPGHWGQLDNGWQWTSGFWAGEAQTEVSYVPPPPLTLETGPSIAAPAVDQFYTPGCWMYVQRQYRWRPGFWVNYRPNWVYTPAHYIWTPVGCVFVDGQWDYELTRRGLLFCPIRFTDNVWARPGWRFTPRYVVYPGVIVGSLFVRIDYHRYCFGDYFGATYVQHGFVPWVDYRLHKNIPEPLFRQFAYTNRKDVNWERDLRKQYDDRRVGLAPRPPRTFAQQEQFMRDLTDHRAIKTANKNFAIQDVKAAERRLTVVNALPKLDRKQFPLMTLTPAARVEAVKTIEHHEQVNVQRKATERAIVTGTPPGRPIDVHPVGKLPVIPQHLQTPKAVVIPAAPAAPIHVEKVVPKYEPPKAPRASPKPLQSSLHPAPAVMAAATQASLNEARLANPNRIRLMRLC